MLSPAVVGGGGSPWSRRKGQSAGYWQWMSLRWYMLGVYTLMVLLAGYYLGRARLHFHVAVGEHGDGAQTHRRHEGHGLVVFDGPIPMARIPDSIGGRSDVRIVKREADAPSGGQAGPIAAQPAGSVTELLGNDGNGAGPSGTALRGKDSKQQSQNDASATTSKHWGLVDKSTFRVYDPLLALPQPPTPTDDELAGTAIVTMATGDEAARHAVALIQSLRDQGTRVPNIVVLLIRGGPGSADCQNDISRRERGRTEVRCDGGETVDVEIVSEKYLQAFKRLGATWIVRDPLPSTPYIEHIPGGRGISWGMALNKLIVFGLTQYRKILWLDGDVLVLRNIDHLLLTPDFTGAFTTDCCNHNADPKLSGGLWVLEPSDMRMNELLEMTRHPKPDASTTGVDGWMFGDMEIVLYRFAKITAQSQRREWPFSRDMRQGALPGLRYLPVYENLTEAEFEQEATMAFTRAKSLKPFGLLPQELATAQKAGQPVWHILDPRYDGLVGNCECVSNRDMPERFFTVHFSCVPVTPPVHKPGRYSDELEFMDHLTTRMLRCMRHYYLKWYDAYTRGMDGERLGTRLWTGPPVVANDPAADERTRTVRTEAFQAALREEEERQRRNK